MKYVIAAALFMLALSIRADDTPPIGNVPTATPMITSGPQPQAIYLPEVRIDPTRTKTPKPIPTATKTLIPTATATPTLQPTAAITPDPARICNDNSAEWQGSNPNYPFCSHHDLSWANSNSNYIVRKLGVKDYASAYWDIYGDQIVSVEARLEENNQLTQCNGGLTGTGAGGFRRSVSAAGNLTFPTQGLGRALYKLELYYTLRDGRTVGRNEVFLCVVP